MTDDIRETARKLFDLGLVIYLIAFYTGYVGFESAVVLLLILLVFRTGD